MTDPGETNPLIQLADQMATTPSRTAKAGPRKPPPARTDDNRAKDDPPAAAAGPTDDLGSATKHDARVASANADNEPATTNSPDATPQTAVTEPKPRGVVTPVAGRVTDIVREKAAYTAAAVAATMAPLQSAGDLVQVRVQPPSVGEWFNEFLQQAEFALGIRKGDVAGAILLIARMHSDELFDLLERFAGAPTVKAKRIVWEALIAEEQERHPTVVDSGSET